MDVSFFPYFSRIPYQYISLKSLGLSIFVDPCTLKLGTVRILKRYAVKYPLLLQGTNLVSIILMVTLILVQVVPSLFKLEKVDGVVTTTKVRFCLIVLLKLLILCSLSPQIMLFSRGASKVLHLSLTRPLGITLQG